MPDMIPDFARCILDARPEWFLMENVPAAPAPELNGEYHMVSRIVDNHWCGGEQGRVRRFTFGHVDMPPTYRFHVPGEALEPIERHPTVVSTGQADWKGSAQRNRATIEYMARMQGLDPARFDHSPFSITELRRAIANGVPLPMGRAVARAVCEAAYGREKAAA